MGKRHAVEKIHFSQNHLHLVVDGEAHEYELRKISRRLAGASNVQRETFRVSGVGYGIHWPLIDEDLSIDGLLRLDISKANADDEKPDL